MIVASKVIQGASNAYPYPTNISPCETYIVEIDGKFESEYGTFMRALKAGLKLMARLKLEAMDKFCWQRRILPSMANRRTSARFHARGKRFP